MLRFSGSIVSVVFFAVVLTASAGAAKAHFSGNSWEYPFGSYIVDIGYDTDVFLVDNYARFDFVLKNEETLEPELFSQVWVRIVKEKEGTQLATGIHHQSIGPTTLLYVFPEEGVYTLEASYRDASGEDIATTSFPISVSAPSQGIPFGKVALVSGSIAVAAALWIVLRRKYAIR